MAAKQVEKKMVGLEGNEAPETNKIKAINISRKPSQMHSLSSKEDQMRELSF